GQIGDTIFEDFDNNGLYDSGTDFIIPGVTIILYEDTNGDGQITAGVDAQLATTVSDGSGAYNFTGLAEGYDYLVSVDPTDVALVSYFDGKYDPDPVPYIESTINAHPVDNLSGAYVAADIGFWRPVPATIGDQVFTDDNLDGVYNAADDTPLSSVTVWLYRDTDGDGNPDANELQATTETATDGTYAFENLAPGNYIVKVDIADSGIPSGYFSASEEIRKALASDEDYFDADFPFVPLIAKAVDKSSANPTDNLTFTVAVNYPGEELLEDVRVIDPLPTGVTYVSSTAGGVYGPYTPLPGTDGNNTVNVGGMAVYSVNQNSAKYRFYDDTGFAGTDASAPAFTSGHLILNGAAALTRDEKIILATIDDNNQEVQGMLWDGTSWTMLPIPPATGTAGYLANIEPQDTRDRWSSAVAYEQLSGESLMVWSNGTEILSNVWNGTTWQLANTSLALPTGLLTSSQPDQMRLATVPGSDDMVLMVSDLNARDYAYVWNGTSWSTPEIFDNCGTTPCGSNTAVHVAYEQQSGQAVAVYGKDADAKLYYRVLSSGTWSAEASFDPGIATGQVGWVSLAADPSSNQLAVGVVTDNNETWLAVWNGSAWGDVRLATGSPLKTDRLNVSVAFETLSGDLIAAYGVNVNPKAQVRYRTYSGGTWSNELLGPIVSNEVYVFGLDSSPSSDEIMLSTNDKAKAANYTLWDGSSWGSVSLAGAGASDSGQPAIFLWDQHEAPSTTTTVAASPTTLALGDPVTVTLTLFTSTAALANVTPSVAPAHGSGSCTTADTVPDDIQAGIAKIFTYTCTPASVGEISFIANAETANGYSFGQGSSNTVLVSSNGATNVVLWDIGSSASGIPGSFAARKVIYAFQGNDQLAFWGYDPATDTWNSPFDPAETPAGVTIKDGAALTHDGHQYIYALRGDVSRVFLRYDADPGVGGNVWDDGVVADLPLTTDTEVRKGGSLTYLNGYVYAFLGNGSQQFWRYDVAGDSWAQMASTPAGVNAGASLTTNGTSVYALQGNNSTGFWEYNVATDTWTPLASTLASIGSGGSLVYANDALYALRGNGQKSFYKYNISGNSWVSLADLADNISDGASLTFDGEYFYAFRGKSTTFYRYTLDTDTWETRAVTPGQTNLGGALLYLESGNVTRTVMAAFPTLVTDSPGDQSITVQLTLTADDPVNNAVAGTQHP
ncbi:MAG: DUF11 domain-containing protein, partial [Candidatus Electrothrix sp. AR4]|nr:DUF11 domain-containing protein [Candidatus Electrothrix sp. AR4]